MREASVVQVTGLTKRFGGVLAVDNLTFSLHPGRITGFLGPNGSGKTTTLRILLGLVTPTAGAATIDGRRYRELEHPSRHVGAVLEASSFHPGRRARDHLRVLATAARLPAERVDVALAQVGLHDAARRRVGGFSLGMRQRLGLASALLGHPRVLILDEPANGLDPQGIHWLRGFLREQARQGCTVLVSSHVLSEVASTVDDVVIISAGRLVTQSSLADLTKRSASVVWVRSPQAEALRDALQAAGVAAQMHEPEQLVAHNTTTEAVGRAAADHRIVIYEIERHDSNLEETFLELTTPPQGPQR